MTDFWIRAFFSVTLFLSCVLCQAAERLTSVAYYPSDDLLRTEIEKIRNIGRDHFFIIDIDNSAVRTLTIDGGIFKYRDVNKLEPLVAKKILGNDARHAFLTSSVLYGSNAKEAWGRFLAVLGEQNFIRGTQTLWSDLHIGETTYSISDSCKYVGIGNVFFTRYQDYTTEKGIIAADLVKRTQDDDRENGKYRRLRVYYFDDDPEQIKSVYGNWHKFENVDLTIIYLFGMR